jgi:hypothetical protein
MVFTLPQNGYVRKEKLFFIDKNILWWIESDDGIMSAFRLAGSE